MQLFKIILVIASWGLVPIIESQPVPKLKKAFVLSNGGPVHWHETVTRGTEIMNKLASGANSDNHVFEVFVTHAPSDITAENLMDTDVLVLNNVSGVDILLNTAEKKVVEDFVAGGGGIHGWHGTTDLRSIYEWPWFSKWISTNYIGPSSVGIPATMFKDDNIKPEHEYILGHWQNRVDMTGELWLQFEDPHPEDNPNNQVLIRVDSNAIHSNLHSLPMVWVNEEKNGRLWASALGHFEALMARDDIVEMLYRGLVYAAGGYVEDILATNQPYSQGAIHRINHPEELTLQGVIKSSHHIQILIALPEFSSITKLSVLNVKGNKIKTLVTKSMNAGHKTVFWDRQNEKGESVPAGIYILRLITEDSNISQLINLLN